MEVEDWNEKRKGMLQNERSRDTINFLLKKKKTFYITCRKLLISNAKSGATKGFKLTRTFTIPTWFC